MTLRELIEKLPDLDRTSTVYVERDRALEPSLTVKIIDIPEEAEEPPVVPGMRCFMDVWHIRDVLSGNARRQGLSAPTIDEKVQMLLSFARNGA